MPRKLGETDEAYCPLALQPSARTWTTELRGARPPSKGGSLRHEHGQVSETRPECGGSARRVPPLPRPPAARRRGSSRTTAGRGRSHVRGRPGLPGARRAARAARASDRSAVERGTRSAPLRRPDRAAPRRNVFGSPRGHARRTRDTDRDERAPRRDVPRGERCARRLHRDRARSGVRPRAGGGGAGRSGEAPERARAAPARPTTTSRSTTRARTERTTAHAHVGVDLGGRARPSACAPRRVGRARRCAARAHDRGSPDRAGAPALVGLRRLRDEAPERRRRELSLRHGARLWLCSRGPRACTLHGRAVCGPRLRLAGREVPRRAAGRLHVDSMVGDRRCRPGVVVGAPMALDRRRGGHPRSLHEDHVRPHRARPYRLPRPERPLLFVSGARRNRSISLASTA